MIRKNQVPVRMKCNAINDSGHLGSLYDTYSDCIFGDINMDDKGQSKQRDDHVSCQIMHGNAGQTEDLIQMVGIEDDLRLNILLNLSPRTRIAYMINHPHSITEYTRFIHYFYVHRKEYLPEDVAEVRKIIGLLPPQTTATHIVTSVYYGLEAFIVLQLSPDSINIKQIDNALGKVQRILNGTFFDRASLPSNDEGLFRQNCEILVYSNIPLLNGMTSMRDISDFIRNSKENNESFRPVTYTLTSIHFIYPQFTGSNSIFIQLESTCRYKLEQYLLWSLNRLEYLKHFLDYKMTKPLCKNIEERLSELRQQLINLENIQENDIKGWRTLVIAIRRGRCDSSEIDRALSDEKQKAIFVKNIDKITQDLRDLVDCNVVDREIDQNDNVTTIEHRLISNNQNARVLCSNDILNKNEPEQEEAFSSKKIPMTLVNNDTINILLLGETGVGKSTFINAFANYLTFDTLKQAQTGHPIVLIPVSFLITVGNTFDEYIVKFSNVDDSNNEDFEHPGQSVTQHCKSYEFNLNRDHGKKLCIIDTPGFGDTRGIDQDDYNMAHILDHIKNLSHLDAICFLLKPNESRLNIFFRSCLTQLFSLCGPNITEKILFCFTNSRSTFYTPGNTAPLLKKMLTSLPMGDVPFKKDNTFCFDSESFRYLVSLQNKIPFSDRDKEEYETSWTKSVIEANRLIDYIYTKLTTYRVDFIRE